VLPDLLVLLDFLDLSSNLAVRFAVMDYPRDDKLPTSCFSRSIKSETVFTSPS
jgi:hypothetical protein